MEREKGITNDGVHCEMKEDMRAFRQRAGSDASLEEWVKQSVWARGTGVDLERAMGAARPLCTPATVCLDDSDASLRSVSSDPSLVATSFPQRMTACCGRW